MLLTNSPHPIRACALADWAVEWRHAQLTLELTVGRHRHAIQLTHLPMFAGGFGVPGDRRNRAILLALTGAVAASLLCADTSRAGISGPPPSYVMPVGNGDRILVMLSPVPLAKDKGDLWTLPTGEIISLRETFPASGLYANGSNTPIWAVDWFANKWELRVSRDGRHVVRINEFGDGGYGRPGRKLSWGIKFYDAGAEVKTHDVADMVDYPALMPLTNADWHLMWYADFKFNESPDGGMYVDVRTSTRDRFRFDARTGELLLERRFWRHVARGGIVAAVLTGLAAIGLITRRFISRRPPIAPAPLLPDTNFTFSLRSLLVIVTCVGVGLGASRYAPRAVILVSSLMTCLYLTVVLVRARRQAPWRRISRRAKRRRVALRLATVFSWLWCYLICAPLFGTMLIRMPWDIRYVMMLVVYGPVLWVNNNTRIFHWAPIVWYLEGW